MALVIILSMLAHHADDFSHDIALGIDHACDTDECVLDAVATCWVESRCRGIDKCGKNGCGPFQQVRRYTTHPELEGLDYAQKTRVLGRDTIVAAEQWRMKRDKLEKRFGDRWPVHYNGSKNKEAYFVRWKKARAWAASILKASSD